MFTHTSRYDDTNLTTRYNTSKQIMITERISKRQYILKAISNTLTFIKDEKEWKQTKTFKKIITFRYKFYFNFLKRFDYRKDLKATLFLKLYQHMNIFQRQKEMKTHENIKK